MTVFTFQAPDGRKIKIEAADQATALRGAQEWAQANPAQPKSDPVTRKSVSVDEMRQFAGQPRNALAALGDFVGRQVQGTGVPAIMGRAADALTGRAADAVMDAGAKAGGQDRVQGQPMTGVGGQYGRGVLEGAQGAAGTIERFLPGGGPLAVAGERFMDRAAPGAAPRNVADRTARLAGQYTLNALMPGSAAQRVKNVLLPAAGGAVAGETAKAMGADQGGQGVAQFAGSVAGGVAAAAKFPKQPKASSASLEDLRSQKNAAYRAVDDMGVQYTPQAAQSLAQGIRETVESGNYDADLHPAIKAALRKVNTLSGEPITLTKLDQVRQFVRDEALSSNSKSERRLGYQIVQNIDEFIDAAGPDQVTAQNVDPARAAATIRQARELNTRVSKMEDVQAAMDRAGRRTKKTYSGGNIDNATRQEIDRMAMRRRNFTSDERAKVDQIVMGTPGQNALRLYGRLSPTGGGLMSALNIGLGLGTGGKSLLVTGGAMIAKHIADTTTQKRVSQLLETIAAGGEGGAQAQSQLMALAQARPDVGAFYKELAGALAAPVAIAASPAQGSERQPQQ